MTIIQTVFKTAVGVQSSTFKTRSTISSTTFKLGGVQSSTFRTIGTFTSTTFGTTRAIVTSTFGTRSGIISTVFKVSSVTLADGVSYSYASDCSGVSITIQREGLTLTDIKDINISKQGSDLDMKFSVKEVDGIITIDTPLTDGVYNLSVTDNDNQVIVRLPMLVVCKINRCFAEINSKEALVEDDPNHYDSNNWLLMYVLYRGIIANFRVKEYDKAVCLLNELNKLCDCGCNSCETC